METTIVQQLWVTYIIFIERRVPVRLVGSPRVQVRTLSKHPGVSQVKLPEYSSRQGLGFRVEKVMSSECLS